MVLYSSQIYFDNQRSKINRSDQEFFPICVYDFRDNRVSLITIYNLAVNSSNSSRTKELNSCLGNHLKQKTKI